jgi:hypothetical protein
MTDAYKAYGFTALPANQSKDKPATINPQPVDISSLAPPKTPLAVRVTDFPPQSPRIQLGISNREAVLSRL